MASFPQVSPLEPCAHLSPPHTRHIPRPSHSARFYHPQSINNTTLYFIYNKNSLLSRRHVPTFIRSSSGPLRASRWPNKGQNMSLWQYTIFVLYKIKCCVIDWYVVFICYNTWWWALLTLRPPISPLTSTGQRNRASWASQPQKSVTLLPCPGGKTTKSTRTCGGIGGEKKHTWGWKTLNEWKKSWRS